MPKRSNLPILYNDMLTLSISDLKKWNYLDYGTSKKGAMSWSKRGVQIAAINLQVQINSGSRILEISYTQEGELIIYYIPLVSINSNLVNGKVWYFECPVTGMRCRNLYAANGKFMHRTAHEGSYYECQVKSQSSRNKMKLFCSYLDGEKALEEIQSKHFKKLYKGRPTKRYSKLIRKVRISESYSVEEVERMYLI